MFCLLIFSHIARIFALILFIYKQFFFYDFAGRTLGKTNESSNTTTANKHDGFRESTRSNRFSTLGTEDGQELDSESERLFFSDDEDIFTEEEDNFGKSLTKEKMAEGQAEHNGNMNSASDPKGDQSLAAEVGLTANQVREIKEAFHVFDVNGDGCISATELKKLVTSLGYNITEAELMDMMNQIGKTW